MTNQISSKEVEIILRELRRVINNGTSGDVVEFGCYDGGTSVHLAKEIIGTDKKLYVYDSFEGLPEKTSADTSPLGLQFMPGELSVSKKQFIKNIMSARVPMPIIKKAWFSDLTLEDVPKQISFAFLDGDYYLSIVDSQKLIEKSIVTGSTIIVDDYGNSALPGVARAVDEWLSRHDAIKKVEQSLAIIYIRN
jgi:O-methyltransferase